MSEFYFACALVLTAIFGLCVGSFLNVVIYRLPNNMSLVRPASHCPSCKYALRWYDNIPVLSYVLLGGRCRSCKTRIPFRYTAVELSNAFLWFLCALLYWEESIPLASIFMIASSVLICIFCIDLEHMIIFDRFHIILLALGALSMLFDKALGTLSHILGGVVGFLLFYLIAALFERFCGKEGLGGGDVKLAGAAGLLLGWERLLLGLLIATIPAAVIMLIAQRKNGESDKRFAFAPFLTTGFIVSMLFGERIIELYLSLLGF